MIRFPLLWAGYFQIVLDECHKAKNLFPSGATKPSKTGLTVLQLQKKLPKARIVYCSATGASEPKNMAYMSRLGIWGKGTQFNTFQDFIKAVERRCVCVCVIETAGAVRDMYRIFILEGQPTSRYYPEKRVWERSRAKS